MLAVPPAVLELLNLGAGDTVGLTVDGDRLIVEAAPKPQYTMAELLDASDYTQVPGEDPEWVGGSAVGRELI